MSIFILFLLRKKMETMGKIAVAIVVAVVLRWGWKLLNWVWLKPKKLEKWLRDEGYKGNSYRFPLGDMIELATIIKEGKSKHIPVTHDITSYALPFDHHIISKYGEKSFAWFGPKPRMYIRDPDLIKEVLLRPDEFQKPHPDRFQDSIVSGLVAAEGPRWIKHRKIINPAFNHQNIKIMFSAIHSSCSDMIHKLELLTTIAGSTEEVDVWPYIDSLAGDVISQTAFGSCYEEGKKIFSLQKEQLDLVLQMIFILLIPGRRFIPTRTSKKFNKNDKEIRSVLMTIINKRKKEIETGEGKCDDLLGILLESNKKEIEEHGVGMSMEDVIEECKLFYSAGSMRQIKKKIWTLIMGRREFIPTRTSKKFNKNDKEIRSVLMTIINKRKKEIETGEGKCDDLLGILLESNKKEIEEHGVGMSMEDVIEECKLFYSAGSETISNLIVWTMVCLSLHQEWQIQAREEILQVFGNRKLDFEGLKHLKILTMILNEVLRLYTPISLMTRETHKETKLGNMMIPSGVLLSLPIMHVHHDPKIWGDDVNDFKPERFAEGIINAARGKGSRAFFPFSNGPRVCIGQNFAVANVKTAIVLILQRFSFELSPSYKHSPFVMTTIPPQFGTHLIIRNIS